MASEKLTHGLRSTIVANAIEARFADEKDSISEEYVKLAHDVYDDVYSKDVQAEMNRLPAGWLPEDSAITVEMGPVYVSLSFNSESARARSRSNSASLVRKRLPLRDKVGDAATYPADHPLAKRYHDISKRSDELDNRIRDARRTLEKFIRQFGTVAALRREWPEVDQFTNVAVTGSSAVTATEVNEMLGLGKRGASDG